MSVVGKFFTPKWLCGGTGGAPFYCSVTDILEHKWIQCLRSRLHYM